MLLIHGNLIIFLPIIFTYALSARTWMFGWFVVYIQYSTKLGTNSQSKLGKFTYPFAAGQYIEIFSRLPTRNSFKVSTFILSLLDESIHCPVWYVHIVPYLLSDYMLIS